MNPESLHLFHEFLADLHTPGLWWQLGVLLACLGLATVIARRLRLQAAHAADDSSVARFGKGGVVRVAFPVTAVLLVIVARQALRQWMPVGILNIAVPLMLSMALVRMGVYVLRQAFARNAASAWLAASEKAVAMCMWGGVALYLTGLAQPLIAMLESVSFKVGKEQFDLWMMLSGAFMVLLTILLALWAGGLIEARLQRSKLDASLRTVLARVAKALLTLLAVLLGLSLVGIDITALSVFGGALGVGLGFGLQKIASNYVSGFIILLDRSISLGNLISLDASTSGLVTQITTRYTVIRTAAGTEVIVPNEYLVSNIVQNQSLSDPRVRLTVRVQVGYDTDVEAVLPLLTDIAKAHPRVLADPAPGALLLNFADSGIDLELGFWIEDPEDGVGNVRSDISREILKAFREKSIEIPFPQREVRLRGGNLPGVGGV